MYPHFAGGLASPSELCGSCSDVQGFVNPPRVRGKGQKGKGQGKDFLTLNKPLTLVKGQGFYFSKIKVQIEFKQC